MSAVTYKPPENIAWREVNGELVVLDMESGEYFTFNEVGRTAWAALADGKNIDEAVSQVIAEYEVAPETAQSDVQSFIQQLISKSLLQQSS